MKKAYEKALKVIDSCKNYIHITATYNYIWNFKALFIDKKDCKKLTKKLYNRCHRKRQLVQNGD